MNNARWRLASLWCSQVARVLADNALRVFIILELAAAGTRQQGAAWHIVMALFIAPAVLLSPGIGALSNTLPRRWVLVGAAAFVTTVLGVQSVAALPWLVIWALVATGAASYSPTRYAMLPAAATETGLPLTRVNGWVETGAALAIVGGLLAGGYLHDNTRLILGLPAAVALALGLNMLAVIFAIPTRFKSDQGREEGTREALLGYFRDFRRLLQIKETRATLVAMAAFRGLVTASTGAVVALTLFHMSAAPPVEQVTEFIRILLWAGAGAALGSFLASLQGNPYRSLALVVIGVTGLALGLALAALSESTADLLCCWIGVMAGLINVPLAATYQLHLPADARGNAMAVRMLCEYLCMTALSLGLAGLAALDLSPAGQFWVVAALATLAAGLAWLCLARAVMDQLFEFLIAPMYHVRGHGPGLGKIPLRGPLIVIANHSAYMDPIWLGKVLPRPITPMMTSAFYDIPGTYFFWKHLLGVLRVEQARFRREAPELRDAVAALDHGDCLVIFPEGSLRRDEERPLRRFGQGIWHILHERPETPVVVCWIEGGWRSFFSYFQGKPMKNKRLDWRRPIDVVVGEPMVLKPEILEEHLKTREFLFERCLELSRRLAATR